LLWDFIPRNDNSAPDFFQKDTPEFTPGLFIPSTTIQYEIPNECHVEIIVYDITGRKIGILCDGKINTGFHEVVWNGKKSKGKLVGSGVYFYQVRAGEFVKSGEMVLMR
jgi:hypothetical protein